MYCGSFEASNTCTGNASTRLTSISVPPTMRKVPVGTHISADLRPMYPLECVICTLDVQSQAPLECGAQAVARNSSAPGGVVHAGRVAIQTALESLRVLAEIMQTSSGVGQDLATERAGMDGGPAPGIEEMISQDLPIGAVWALGRVGERCHEDSRVHGLRGKGMGHSRLNRRYVPGTAPDLTSHNAHYVSSTTTRIDAQPIPA